MKTLRFLLAGFLAFSIFTACSDDEDSPKDETVTPGGSTTDEQSAADNASISSLNDIYVVTSTKEGTLTFDNEGGEATIYVSCGVDWTVTCSDEAVFTTVVDVDGGTLAVAVGENSAGDNRTAEVVFATAESGIEFAYLHLFQGSPAEVSIEAEDENPTLYGVGGVATFTVVANCDWTVEAVDEWLEVSADGDEVTVTVTGAHTDYENPREGSVLVTAANGLSVATATFTLTQVAADPKYFVLMYTIREENTQIKLPLCNNLNITVDWGDGSAAETFATDYPSHTYANAGDYYVNVDGNVNQIRSYDINGCQGDTDFSTRGYLYSSENPNTTLIAVKQWGESTNITNMQYAFMHCTNFSSLPSVTGEVFKDNVQFQGAFAYTSLETIPDDLMAACLTTVLDIRSMFQYSGVTAIPDGFLTGFNSNVGSAECMFDKCASLAYIPEDLFDDCGLNDFHMCFYACRSLTSLPTGLFAGDKNVANLIQTFRDCYTLSGESPYSMIDSEKCHLYDRESDAFKSNFTGYPVGNDCFGGCDGLSDFSSMPSLWKGVTE